MKIWYAIIVVLLCGFLGWGVWTITGDRGTLDAELTDLRAKVQALAEENASLTESIEYYQNPENLLKELKSQFNYREEGEHLIILVPGTTSTDR
jgi:hypothetical protein